MELCRQLLFMGDSLLNPVPAPESISTERNVDICNRGQPALSWRVSQIDNAEFRSNDYVSLGRNLRARAKITSHFCISASAHLWPMPHSQNPRNSSLFLWFCSLGSAKPEPNPSANSAKLFLREPLGLSVRNYLQVFDKCINSFSPQI